MLPQVVKAPNFPKKLSRNKYLVSNRSYNENHKNMSTSQGRIKSRTRKVQRRMVFNGNFTGKNSIAKRYRKNLFNSGIQITLDFDPNTVYRGIEDVDAKLEELEENIDNLDQGDLDDYANEQLNEEIYTYLENNKQLLEKVNACAGVVAKGIYKAALIKNSRVKVGHKEEVNITTNIYLVY